MTSTWHQQTSSGVAYRIGPNSSAVFPEDQVQRLGSLRGSFGFINRIVMSLDFLATLIMAMALETTIFATRHEIGVAQRSIVALVSGLTAVGILHLLGVYRVERYARWNRSVLDLVRGAGAVAVVLPTFLRTYQPDAGWNVREFATVGASAFAALAAARLLAQALHHDLSQRGFLRRHVAVVGGGDMAREIAASLQVGQAAQDFTLVGIFNDAAGDRKGEPRSGVDSLLELAQRRRVDIIVLALPWARQMFDLAASVQWISADIVVPVETTNFLPEALVRVGDYDMLRLASHPLRGTAAMVKLVEDYAVAIVAVVATLPVMAAAAIAVRLSGEGPVIFRQQRMGINGKLFSIYKFRTMHYRPEDDGSIGAQPDDPRVTKVGAILRKTSIDELPQLFNVLRGEMSIVGPRPHVPGMVVEGAVYSKIVRTYAARHSLKPGLTGWAQVNGARDGIHSLADAKRSVEHDLYYIRNWSLRLDFSIMLRTLTGALVVKKILRRFSRLS